MSNLFELFRILYFIHKGAEQQRIKGSCVMGQQSVTELSKFIANIDQFFDCLNVSTVSQGSLHPTRKPYTSEDDWRLMVRFIAHQSYDRDLSCYRFKAPK